MQFGIDSFAAMVEQPGSATTPTGADRLALLLGEIEAAEQAGIDVFGIGEHHRAEFLDSAPAMILAAAAARTSRIRLTSAVTVLSAADPVRVFQDFSTLDLISRGRAEMVVGRGSFGEAFPLFGYAREDYDALFAEKLELLLKLNVETHPTWSGRYRPALQGQGVYPRPHQSRLPIWLGVGGTPQSFVRAGLLGLPLMIGVIGGSFDQFVPAVRLYREAGARAGHDPATLAVAVHAMGFVADTDAAARNAFFPGWAHMMGQAARERGWAQPTRSQFDAACSPQGSFLIGDPATVATKIVAADAILGGLARITFQMSTAMWEPAAMLRSIELVGNQVMNRVQRQLPVGQTHA